MQSFASALDRWYECVESYPLEEWATQDPKPERLTMISRKGSWYRESEARVD